MMPDPEDPDHIARVSFGPPVPVSDTVRLLNQAIRAATPIAGRSPSRRPTQVLARTRDGGRDRGWPARRRRPRAPTRCSAWSGWPNGGNAASRVTGGSCASGPSQSPHRRDGVRPRRTGRGARWRPYRYATSAYRAGAATPGGGLREGAHYRAALLAGRLARGSGCSPARRWSGRCSPRPCGPGDDADDAATGDPAPARPARPTPRRAGAAGDRAVRLRTGQRAHPRRPLEEVVEGLTAEM